MGKSELWRRSLEKGAFFIDLSRERAEALVKDLVDEGLVRKSQAEETIDTLVKRSKRRTEALAGLIRREVADQLASLGVATKDDIARLEDKLEASSAMAGPESSPTAPAAMPPSAPRAKAAPITKSVLRDPASGTRSPAKRASQAPPPTTPPEDR